jgi:hypothetical protein
MEDPLMMPNKTHSIPRTQLGNAFLPFDKLDVWHSFKFSLDTLGNDVDGQEGKDSVRAQPGRGEASSARFDVVMVTHTDEAETTGPHGEPPRLCFYLTALKLSIS